MLFNSYAFLFLFLPVVLVGYQVLGRLLGDAALKIWLVAASLFFYGWWEPTYVALVLASMVFNYSVGRQLLRSADGAGWLVIGIAGNLLLLGYFKYFHFVIDNLNHFTGAQLAFHDVVLPIGISFFTFTQIAYLVDLRRGVTENKGVLSYALFVTFFPHLIAGPIVHHRELADQFDRLRGITAANFAVGVGLLSLGLFKKVVVADSLAPYADQVFNLSGAAPLTQVDAWSGALAYTFQLYFDFSGYADMAVGLSRMLGIAMPCNFDSPYKAASIIEFWRRWHMTLSRFIRDYLYIPLGGSRCGWFRRHANLLFVMVCAGLWHGAGWTFIVWGGMHGVLLLINHVWRSLPMVQASIWLVKSRVWRLVTLLTTFVAVVSTWVVFRAENVNDAWHILGIMYGIEPSGATEVVASSLKLWIALASLLAVAWWAPNSQQLLGVMESGELSRHPFFRSIFRSVGAAVIASIAFAAVAMMQRPSPFLYFQF